VISADAGESSNNWNDFRQKAESYYYSTISSDIRNFSCLFTTNTYIDFAKGLGDTAGTYPLKFVWTRAGKIYYVLQPSVLLTDSLHRKKTLEKIQQTKNQFYGFYLDWYNFLILSPFDGVPDTARVKFAGDTVQVSYENQSSGEIALIKKIFLKSGRLIQVEIDSRNERVLNYPQYREVGEKWLCYGFDTQIIRNQQVTSGLSTRMELAKISSYWMPTRVDIVVQTIDKPNEKYLSVIFLKDYQVNLALQELTPPPAAEKKGEGIR
jgi:hypothetical protein